MKKTKLAKTLAIMALSAVLSASTFTVMTQTDTKAEESGFTISDIQDKCKDLTEDDSLEGELPLGDDSDITLGDYITNMEAGTYYLESNRVVQMDHIHKIIPEELFRNVGNWFYSGKAYSFYVETWEPHAGPNEYYSNVAIIDNTYEFKENIGEVKTGVKLFTKEYRSFYSIPDGVFCSEVSGETSKRFYLSDVQFFTNVKNEHDLNEGDIGYDKEKDNGVIIQQTRLNYNGLYDIGTGFTIKPALEKGIDIILGCVFDQLPGLNLAYKIATEAESWVSILDESLYDKTKYVSNGNEANINTNLTREQQKLSEGGYVRYVSVRPKESGLLINDAAEEITVVADGTTEANIVSGVSYYLYVDDIYEDYVITNSGKRIVLDESVKDNTDLAEEDLPIMTCTETVGFQQEDILKEGENEGYLLRDNSEQVFRFTPARNGNYKISTSCNDQSGNKITNDKKIVVKNDKNETIGSNEKSQELYLKNLEANKEYIFDVQFFDRSADSNVTGRYNIIAEFSPQKAEVGDGNTRDIRAFENEYFSFEPDETGIYTLNLQTLNRNIIIRVDSLENGATEKTGNGDKTLSLYLSKDKEYYFVFTNNTDNAESIRLILNKGEEISEGETIPNVTIGNGTIYTFSPTHNGDYKFSYSSTDIVDFNIRNDNFVKLYSSNIGEQGSYTEYYEAGKVYYIEVNGYVDNTQVSVSMSFSPLVTEGRSIAVSNISDYNIVKFVPHVSGQYTPTIAGDDALVRIYNAGGTDVTNQKLTKGNAYYIVIRNAAHDMGRLEITLSCDRLYNNVQYSVKSGSNSVAFIAPITGTYSFSGLTAYMVFGSDYSELYDQNSNKINLVANET